LRQWRHARISCRLSSSGQAVDGILNDDLL
jgi:hypothetical protein